MAVLFIYLLVFGFSTLAYGEEGFYNIAHMTNTQNSVNWALDKGANGVEIDLTFDTISGFPIVFRHSKGWEPCDCTCLCLVPFSGLCKNSVCAQLSDDSSGHSPFSACRAESHVTTMLNFLASKSRLALIIIDSKIDGDDMDENKMKIAGEMVVSQLITDLFEKGFGGKVIIGSPTINTSPYLKAAADALKGSQYQSRVYFTVYLEQDNIDATLRELHNLPTRNIVYGTGTSPCLPMYLKDSTMNLAARNKAEGVTGLTYLWTVDAVSTIKRNLPYIQGVLSNYPGMVDEILRDYRITLATQSSTIPPATSSNIITSSPSISCDCDYHLGGCTISRPAPAGMACHCEYKGFWACGGTVYRCTNPNSKYCSNPDDSVHSCLLGDGDCEGYENVTCDCDYHSGGCTISHVPPKNTSCHCYKGLWGCGGSITRCKNIDSNYCSNPDSSIHTCRLGGGDCGGY